MLGIVIGHLIFAIVLISGITRYWPWISGLNAGQGAFLGALSGLLAILAGALLNAELNRQRDNRLQLNHERSLAAALAGELRTIESMSREAITAVEDIRASNRPYYAATTGRFEAMPTIIYERNADKIGSLNPALISQTVAAYGLRSSLLMSLKIIRNRDPDHRMTEEFVDAIKRHSETLERAASATAAQLEAFAQEPN